MKQSFVHRMAILAAAAAITLVCASVQNADARPRPTRSSNFSANKQFGLGVMFGAPTAISGKYFLGPDTALDFGVGVINRWRGRDGLHLHADFLWHPVSLVNAQPFVMPLYFGVGARIWDWDDGTNNDLNLGVRVPIGIALDFNNVPIDIFLEFAVVIDLTGDGRGDGNGALGIRYYFF